MDDFFHDIQEDVRRDNIINFFKTYGKHILAASIAIALLTGGFLYWQHYQARTRAQYADAYAKALIAINHENIPQALTELESIGKAASGYTALAELKRAAVLMQPKANGAPSAEDKASAVKIYQDLAKNSKVDMKLRHLATILLVLATFEQEDPQKLLALLGPLSVSSNPWTALATELTALLNFKMGNVKQAEKLYQNLIEMQETPDSIRMRSKALVSHLKTAS